MKQRLHLLNTLTVPTLLLLGLIPQARLAGQAETLIAESGLRIEAETTVPLRFPQELVLAHGIGKGWARIVFVIEEDGSTGDFVLAEASHPAFGRELMRAIPRWEFNPVTNEEGETITARVSLNTLFQYQGPIIHSFSSAVREFLNQEEMNWYYSVADLSDLDRIPDPVGIYYPDTPEELKKEGITGEVSVEFFIDEEGRVRAPRILSASDPRLGQIALNAVWNWRFEPPVRRGKPVTVRAVQTFKFDYSDYPGAQASANG